MAKGRIKEADLNALHGTGDGFYSNQGYSREIKGSNRTDITENEYEKVIIKYKKDPTLSAHINGQWRMISSETIDKKGSNARFEQAIEEEENLTDSSIPKTKRKYLNPANGKLVGYARAKNLGLID